MDVNSTQPVPPYAGTDPTVYLQGLIDSPGRLIFAFTAVDPAGAIYFGTATPGSVSHVTESEVNTTIGLAANVPIKGDPAFSADIEVRIEGSSVIASVSIAGAVWPDFPVSVLPGGLYFFGLGPRIASNTPAFWTICINDNPNV